MGIYGQIFRTFFKVGAFTIGGGYAMLPLIQREVVERKKWIPENDFIDMIAVSQSVPGILAVNIAIFAGYRLRGTVGSIVATAGVVLPSFLIIWFIAMFFRNFQDNPYVLKMFRAIRPAVVALIAVPVFTTARAVGIGLKTVIIPVAAAFLIGYWGVSPVYVVLAAALGGLLWGVYDRKKIKND
ncbi:MAG: chromate transporter [Dysgonamonadaceae bacterium]|jgi:chromate transporter|nr:chromate transporter [Dysgonamonadaceae bacterium]